MRLIDKTKIGTFRYLGIFALLVILMTPAYAEPTVKTTDGGTINVGFETNPASPNPGDQTLLEVSFINKQTNSLQPHVDYRVSVSQGGNQEFGIPITHTGAVEPGAKYNLSIPYQFQNKGTYEVKIEVDGILFQPIPPETATFTVNVGGVSSGGDGSGQNQTGGSDQTPTNGTIKIPKWVKNNAGWWADGSIGDNDFVKGIQWLITNGVMTIPHGQSGASSSQPIPTWVKHNAGWWADGSITDDEFVKGIQWLITNGIIVV